MTDEMRQEKEQEILNLISHLTAPTSEIGDRKIIKYQEYVLVGKEPPYDIQEIHTKRQAVRDRINELRAELNA